MVEFYVKRGRGWYIPMWREGEEEEWGPFEHKGRRVQFRDEVQAETFLDGYGYHLVMAGIPFRRHFPGVVIVG